MKHVPVLLCGAMLFLATTAQTAAAPEAAHPAPSPPRAGQRVARADAPSARAGASDSDEGACLAMIADDPDGALDHAEDWARHGGADAAERCRALASVALGDPDQGATVLDRLSRNTALPAGRRALVAAEASRAWLLAGKPDFALAASGLAVELDPTPDHVIDHARAALAAHQPALAIHDLSPVLALHADLADALIVRASALRQTGALDRARTDIESACRLEPDAPDALLERGILRERTGDLNGAREDWSRIVASAPDTHEADLAQQDLALLDAGPEAR